MRKAVIALAVFLSFDARADGAFPTGMQVLLPAGNPSRILLGASFGLVVSEDGGTTWRYACEPYVTGSLNVVFTYQLAQDGAVIAAHGDNVSRSADEGCGWTRATGFAAGVTLTDAFPNPGDAASVLAIGLLPSGGAALFPSNDGGRSFGAPLLASGTPPLGSDEQLVSVEIALSASNVVYATAFRAASGSTPAGAALLRSADGGSNWSRFEIAVGGGEQVKIAQVDPADAGTVYLLFAAGGADELRVTSDGGATVQPLLAPNAGLGGFVRASDGTLYAGTTTGDFYVRPPGGSFQRLPGPHLRCLGERAGRVYACGDSILDGYDLATSDDQGRSFEKRLSFTQIEGPLTCPAVQSACATDYVQLQRTLALFPTASCSCGGGPSGSAAVLFILLAALLRRRRRAPATGPR
jgi:uncharacterized protein (TIGR03382 family)